MAIADRRNRIAELVTSEGSITFAQLKEAFPSVSEMTLRTDLKALDDERRIVRVHGGAKSVSFAVGTDDLFARRVMRNTSAKHNIALKAAALIRPDTTIFIDSGSTTTAMASVIPDVRLLVFTNSVTVASELARLEKVTTMLVGGRLNRESMCTCGGSAIERVSALSFDQLFLGVTGYERGRGFACGLDDEAVLKRTVLSRSDESFALMDSGKEGRHSTFPICTLDQVDAVISDGGLSADFIADCARVQTEII